MTGRVMAGIATIPERAAALEQTLASIAPQVDEIHLSLNDYTEPPAFLDQFPTVRATVRATNGGDAEKFAAVDNWDGFVVTIDDDLLYPPDYVETLLAGLARHGGDKLVSFHGGITRGWNGAALAATHKQLRCLGDLAADDTDVNVVGTGVLAYDARKVPVWRDVFRSPNMADVHLACHAHRLGIPMVVLAHEQGWLQNICPDEGRCIYDSNRRQDGTRCDTHKQRQHEMSLIDWEAATVKPRVRVSIATCNRPDLLLELLHDLDREAGWVSLEVAIYEDPTTANYDAARAFCRQRGWTWYRFPGRLGVRDHYKLVSRELYDTKRSKADWFLFLPDDIRLNRHAIARAITIWHRLDDPATLTLWRLRAHEGQTNWTGKHAVQHAHASEIFHVDGLYLCRRPTLELLGYGLADPRPTPGRSSGVGRRISLTLDRAGARMYRVDKSLVTVNDHGRSVMNPAERRKHPAIAL